MKTFQLTKRIEAVCQSQNTRYGFRHLVTLFQNGREIGSDKLCYYNRTWERYEFESVLERLIERNEVLSKKQKAICNKFIKNGERIDDDLKPLKTIALVARFGEVLAGDSQKTKNDWKLRILKAGLQNKGLDIPSDWRTLTEKEKEKRLNGAIEQLGS